ncbi:urokinase plasminogen activator surface receptor-like [Oncorhynchus tshawytscha]|uniref:urokinase plasminogen activator surface receptor-like n=1 Tax=Oncorhynchus tshawytscha TaxID=74940 RepID=UPI000D09B61A|nr:urokinase plasminogen activator surface receptor-like [Oncorhynchus tshawytscha]
MKLILTISCAFTLFYTADMLNCYTCEPEDEKCRTTVLKNCVKAVCSTLTSIEYPSDSIRVSKGCTYVAKNCYFMDKVTELSMNNGYSQASQSSFCCNTTGCNIDTLPALSDKPNKLQCHTWVNGTYEVLQCIGIEDHCFKYKQLTPDGGKVTIYGGCASSDSCLWSEMPNQTNLNCCKGSLCNKAMGMSLSSLPLLLGLLLISLV